MSAGNLQSASDKKGKTIAGCEEEKSKVWLETGENKKEKKNKIIDVLDKKQAEEKIVSRHERRAN